MMNSTESQYLTPDTGGLVSGLPDQFHRRSATETEIRGGGGFLSLFGLPFLAAGVFLLLAAFGVIEVRFDGNDTEFTRLAMIGMGLIFAGVGGVFVFGRSWIRIDQAAGTITRCKGLLVPIWRTVYRTADYGAVALTHDPGDSDTSERFPVALRPRAGALTNTKAGMALTSPVLYAVAYEQAVYLAEFLQLPIEDSSTGAVRRLEPSQLRETFQERLRADEARKDYVNQPFSLRSTVERAGDELMITVPADPIRLLRLLPSLLMAGVAIYFYRAVRDFLDQTNTPPEMAQVIRLAFIVFMVVFPALGLLRAYLHSRRGFSQLTVTRDRVIVSRRNIVRVHSNEIPLAAVIDIDCPTSRAARSALVTGFRSAYGGDTSAGPSPLAQHPIAESFVRFVSKHVPSRGIIIKSRKGVFEFGGGLPDEEVAYLGNLVRSWIREH